MNVENIKEKIKNKIKLKKEEITYLVNGYTLKEISDKDMGEVLLLIKEYGLSYKETFYLTEAMVNSGEILDLSNIKRVVVDKHSTGGVGDKTSLIVAPIVAACGLSVAKMSGRSLGFTGGTIDKLESIEGYRVNLKNEEFEKIVNEVGVSIISQTGSLAPADKVIYALRDEVGAVESIPLIASSIMSKKIASGAKYIVIDLKVGEGAFMKNEKDAKTLAKYMIKIGKYFGRTVVCVLTDMSTPLGYTIGNSIEVEEALYFFLGKREKRLLELVKKLSSIMVSMGKNMNIKKAEEQVDFVLSSGLATHKFKEWIKAQGGNLKSLSVSDKTLTLKAKKDGFITKIDPMVISEFVFSLGAGRKEKEDDINRNVGVRLLKTIYDEVKAGEDILEVYYTKEKPDIKILERAVKVESIIKSKKDIIISVIK